LGLKLHEKIDLISDPTVMSIIHAVRRCGSANRTTIAEAAGVTITTVSRLLAVLLDKNVRAVREDPVSREISIVGDFAYTLGVHAGASKLRISVCDFALNNLNAKQLCDLGVELDVFDLAKSEIDRLTLDPNKVISVKYTNLKDPTQEIARAIDRVIQGLLRSPVPLISICISTPAIVNYQNDMFAFCPNIPSLNGKYARSLIYEEASKLALEKGVLICFEHDTEAALVRQRELLYKREAQEDRREWGYDNIALVYQGSGTGAAFNLNRKLYRGRGGAAGEVGNLRAPWMREKFRYDSEEFPLEPFSDEENLLKKEIRDAVSRPLTIEEAIRSYVFNVRPGDLEGYLKKIGAIKTDENGKTYYALRDFKKDMPNRYELLLEYLLYVTNVLVDLLSMDIIIFGGPVFDRLGDGIIVDLARRKYEGTVQCLARDANIIRSEVPPGEDMVAVGAATVALYNCHANNQVYVTYYSGQSRPVCIEWLGEN